MTNFYTFLLSITIEQSSTHWEIEYVPWFGDNAKLLLWLFKDAWRVETVLGNKTIYGVYQVKPSIQNTEKDLLFMFKIHGKVIKPLPSL